MIYPLKEKETNGRYFGDYSTICKNTDLTESEHLYRQVWAQAKRFCESAGISPTRVRMIVKLLRCEREKDESLGIHCEEATDGEIIMTIGWKVWLTNEEISKMGNKMEMMFAQ